MNRREVGKGVPDTRRPRALPSESARGGGGLAVGLRSLLYVVAPTDVVAVHQIREIGPGIVGCGVGWRAVVGWVRHLVRVARAAQRVAGTNAERRPLRDKPQ